MINSSGNLNNTKKTIKNKLIKNNKNKIKKMTFESIWIIKQPHHLIEGKPDL